MLLAAFGLPGAMSAWGFAAFRIMANKVLTDWQIIDADTLQEFLGKRTVNAARVLLISQFPEAELVDLVVGSGARVVVFLEDTSTAVSYLTAHMREKSGLDLIRAVSASAACLTLLHHRPAVLTVHGDEIDERDPISLLSELLRHVQLDNLVDASPTDGAFITGLAKAIVDDEQLPRWPVDTAAGSSNIAWCTEDLAGLACNLLQPFDLISGETPVFGVTWPQSVFLLGDRPGEAAPDIVDLAGRARCLIYGPYLHLLPGRWVSDITIGFEGRVQNDNFLIEIVGGGSRQRFQFSPGDQGLFTASLNFVVAEPRIPIELRVIMQTGAIEGAMSLREVRMSRLA